MVTDNAVNEIEVTLPDGSSRRLPEGATGADLAASIGRGLAKAAVAAVVDGAEVDLTVPLPPSASVSIVTSNTDEGRAVMRHSTAHVMAQAVCDLFPGAKYAIGPPIKDGFYYDFELPGGAHFSDDDLGRIEARMREIVAEDQSFVREELSRDEGLARFADQPFKMEIIEGVDPGEGAADMVVSTYRNDGWVDLCRGPHVPSTSRLPAFKLMKVAGAYWRGDEQRPMLQRIYGTAWESDKALAAHLQRLEEAEKRDHRRLGPELDLFSFPEELGAGLAVWHPKGAMVRRVMEEFSRQEHETGGYEFVFTPHLAKSGLWETSGHLDYYAESMYPPMELEGASYYPKPMSCPFHVLIYRSHQRSYRELPVRLFELGTVYRFERSGVIHGLLRTRGFTQDDAHIFCTREQIVPELESLLNFVLRILRTFGFESFTAEISTRPVEKSVGSDEDWELATRALFDAIEPSGLPFRVAAGEGAFYGPKIDIYVEDAIGRPWQLSTLQVDFQNPARFGLEYVGADNSRHQPIMIHRALFGSVERFFGILLEHYAGAFPAWLAPVQARVLGVRDDHDAYALDVAARLREAGFRVDTEVADEPLGGRIRRAKMEKLPYVLVVGDDDVAAGTVGVNPRGGEVQRGVTVDDFLASLRSEVADRR
ncbi:MAG TPA: threonine--tRNA ligase [Acidimicrobiales bacterium]|nr:threonine--tRNA ligase [Acidimicrobiales bacterium]